MLTALQPLGAKNTVHIIADYDGDNVTVTVAITPKGKDDDARKRTIQVSGTVAEVDEKLIEVLTKTATSVVKFQSTLEELEAENAKDIAALKEKSATTTKKIAKAKPVENPDSDKAEESAAPPVPQSGGLDLDKLIAEANAKK
jgi:PRTRC genetic system protein E